MTFVATLSTELTTLSNPTWTDIERAIAALDGETETSVILAPDEGQRDGNHYLGIAGGLDGLCVVNFTEDNQHFSTLEDATKSSTKRVVMVAGGQEGDFRETECVPKEWALKAAREYFDRGARAASLPWKDY